MKPKRIREPRIRKLGGLSAASDVPECRPKYVQAGEELELSSRQCAVFPAGKFLGKGKFASAYEHADNQDKVVKFTTDADDAKSAAVLKGKDLRGAARVYQVAQLIDRDVWLNEAVYGIVTERLTPVTELDAGTKAAVTAFAYEVGANFTGVNFTPGPRWSKTVPPTLVSSAIQRCIRWATRDKGDAAMCHRVVPKLEMALTEVATAGGIFTPDLHTGNWGVRPDGSFAILDFGISKADPTRPVPQVESLAKAPKRRKRRRR